MATKSTAYYESVKVIRAELNWLSDHEGHALDSRKFQKFLYECINFLSSQSPSAKYQARKELDDWFVLVSQVFSLLFQRRKDWDEKYLNLHNIITYLNHITFHLVKIKEISLDWHKYLGCVILESLALYSNLPTAEADFIADVALKSYAFLCTAGQKVEKDKDSKQRNVWLCYELYLLGAAILSIHRGNKTRDGLKSAKDLLVIFSQSATSGGVKCSPAKDKSGEKDLLQRLSRMVDITVMGYTMQPRDITDDISLSFYVELFRLVEEEPSLREKLLACEGNLFKYEIGTDISSFLLDAVLALREANSKVSMATLTESKVQDIVLPVLTFVHTLDSVICEQQKELGKKELGTTESSRKAKSSKTSATLAEKLEKKVMEDMGPILASIEALMQGSSKSKSPLSPAIGDCLMALVHSVPASRLLLQNTLMVCFKLVSLAVEVFVRDILCNASKESQFNFVAVRVYTLAIANKTRLSLLQLIVVRDQTDPEKVNELSAVQKAGLTALCQLAHTVKTKKLLNPESNSYKQVFKCLENAMCGLASIGRQLRRLELHQVAVSLFAPVWPVNILDELISLVGHHETLAESYRKTSQLEKAFCVIAEAVKLNASLLTDFLIKTLIKIIKEDSRISVMKMFDWCKEDQAQYAQILAKLTYGFLSSGQSPVLVNSAVCTLEALVNLGVLSECERAVHNFLLAEIRWFNVSVENNNQNGPGSTQDMLKKVCRVLEQDSTHQFDDYLAQSTFLFWEILHRQCCVNEVSMIRKGLSLSKILAALNSSPSVGATGGPPGASSTPLMQVTTPQVPQTVNTPTEPVVPTSSTEGNCAGTPRPPPQVDSEFLMKKATQCLVIWIAWYQQHGQAVMGQADGMFRAEKSLELLQRISDTAAVNHQTFTAMRALCYARNVAELTEKEDVIKRVTGAQIALLPQLGLQYQPEKSDSEDVFMAELGLGQDCHVLHIAAVAAHHLKCGKFEQFTQVSAVATKLIEESREKGPLTPNVTIALAMLKRLNAEFFSQPRDISLDIKKDDVTGLNPYPIDLAGESLKYVSGAASFFLGEEYKTVTNRGPSVDTSRIIHEYLCSLMVVGELYLNIGNVKYARTHFHEGWTMARSCLFRTWSAFFLSRIAKTSLDQCDSTIDAQEVLKRALSILKHHITVRPDTECPASPVSSFLDLASSKEFFCSLHTSNGQRRLTTSKNCTSCESINDVTEARRRLFLPEREPSLDGFVRLDHAPGSSRETGDNGEACDVFCPWEDCQQCMNPEILAVCISMMLSQAEIVNREKGPLSSICKLLKAAGCTARRLTDLSWKPQIDSILKTCNLKFSFVPQDVNSRTAFQVETLARVAEYSFQKLYLRDEEENAVTEEMVKTLLDAVAKAGKEMKGFANSNILVAWAQLLRLHLPCIQHLRTRLKDEEEEEARLKAKAEELKSDNVNSIAVEEGSEVIAKAIFAAGVEKTRWDQMRRFRLNMENNTEQNSNTPKTSTKESKVKTTKKKSSMTGVRKAGDVKSAVSVSGSSHVNPAKSIVIFEDSENTPVVKPGGKKKGKGVDPGSGDDQLGNVSNKLPAKAKKSKASTRAKKQKNQSEQEDITKKLHTDADVSPLSSKLNEMDLNSDLAESNTEQARKKLGSVTQAADVICKDKEALASLITYLRKYKQLMDSTYEKMLQINGGYKIDGRGGRRNLEESAQPEKSGLEVGQNLPKQDSHSDMKHSLLVGDADADAGANVENSNQNVPSLGATRKRQTKCSSGKQNKTELLEIPVTKPKPRRGRKAKVCNAESPESRRAESLQVTPMPKLGDLSCDRIVASPVVDSPAWQSECDRDVSNRLFGQSYDEEYFVMSEKPSYADQTPLSKLCKSGVHKHREGNYVLSEINLNSIEMDAVKFSHVSPIEMPRGRPQRKKTQSAKQETPKTTRQKKREANAPASTEKNPYMQGTANTTVCEASRGDKENQLEFGEVTGPGTENPAQSDKTQTSTRKSRLSLKKTKNKAMKLQPPNESVDEPMEVTPTSTSATKALQQDQDHQAVPAATLDEESSHSSATDMKTSGRSKAKLQRKRCSRTDLSNLSTSSELKTKRNGNKTSVSDDNSDVLSSPEGSPLAAVTEKLYNMELEDIEDDSLVVEEATPEQESSVGRERLQEKEEDVSCPADVQMAEEEAAELIRSEPVKSIEDYRFELLTASFPMLAVFPQADASRIQCLKETLQQLQHFPHSFLYRQVSRSLALALWETDIMKGLTTPLCPSTQREIAAHLTNSEHVTFQHLMTRNLQTKLRKSKEGDCPSKNTTDKRSYSSQLSDSLSDWSSLTPEQLQLERESMTSALTALRFGGDVMERFCERLNGIPAGWTVIQLSVVDFDPLNPGRGQLFVTRLTSHLEPLTVAVPCNRWKHFAKAMKVYTAAVTHNVENITPEVYWMYRYKRDRDMQNLVVYLQEYVLGGHKWLLRGQLECVRDKAVQQLLDRMAQDAVVTVKKWHEYTADVGTIRVLMEVLLWANDVDLADVVKCIWHKDVAETMISYCMLAQFRVFEICGDRLDDKKRKDTVLILDKSLNHIPWDNLPLNMCDPVTRMPSLASLHTLLMLHEKKPWSPYQCGVKRDSAVAIIDPETNLRNAKDFLLPQFQQYKGWTCMAQKVPTVAHLKAFLTNHSLYLYCGHGWGRQFVGGDDLQMFRGRAVAIIMGCHSGKLDYRPRLDGDGGPLYFLLAGCPAVVGNLWLVTDKDIDKLTSTVVSKWMSKEKVVPLTKLLTNSRGACKLVGLNGYAPIIYGLPVMMNT